MANIEGEAAKRAAGASTNSGLSSLFGGMKKARGKGSSEKSGADYHNETLAKLYDHGISESAKESDFGREGKRTERTIETARINKAEGLGIKGEKSTTPHAGGYQMELYSQPSPQRESTKPRTGSGGQGTSGNTKGTQFKRNVGKAVKDATVAGAGAAAGAAAAAVTKNTKVAQAAATLGSAGAEAVINKVASARSSRASGKPKA